MAKYPKRGSFKESKGIAQKTNNMPYGTNWLREHWNEPLSISEVIKEAEKMKKTDINFIENDVFGEPHEMTDEIAESYNKALDDLITFYKNKI